VKKLVIGASGFLGSHVARQLVQNGEDVQVMVRRTYARERGLPVVAMCISTTYGPRDWQPTPHRSMIARVAGGRFPFYLDFSSEVVGIEDAARAMLLAADHGRPGERYAISDRYMSTCQVHEIAAAATGVRRPRIKIALPVLYGAARLNDAAARLLRRDLRFAVVGVRMAELMSPLDHRKAEREFGWTPEPVESPSAGPRVGSSNTAPGPNPPGCVRGRR